jgi:hypothetical protein
VALEAQRRDQQVALYKALGGGFDAQQAGLAGPGAVALKRLPEDGMNI